MKIKPFHNMNQKTTLMNNIIKGEKGYLLVTLILMLFNV